MKSKKQLGKDDQIEDLYPKLLLSYKRKCDLLGIIPNQNIRQRLQKSVETFKFDIIKIDEPIGPLHVRAIADSMIELKYDKLKFIQIWKSKIGDEGIRNLCKYLESRQTNQVENFDVLENQITHLGCQFLGKVLSTPFTKIKYLKLDDNLIGNKGLQNLSIGLRINGNLTKLSLKYCGINQKGVKYIQDILANIKTKIRSIKLQGNPLGNEGIFQLLRVVDLNQTLQKINIADTKLNLLDFVSKNLYVLQERPEGEEEEQQAEDEDPFRKGTPASNIENVKQVILPGKQQPGNQKVGVLKELKPKNKKEHYRVTKSINDQDKSISANIMRLLSSIMAQNLLIKKYDLRFNPISNDAATILFEIIEHNSTIKDVEMNNNVDNVLRENLDTLMRKRTGRMPKGRGAKAKGKKKK